jgi:DNA-binding LacI/PurR family transcriptional regulator
MSVESTTRKKARITCKGVAQLAGVGIGTVSRVLNGASNVSPEVRKKVLDVIQATNYRPCSAAGVLARQRYNCIGLVSETELQDTSYSTSLIQGISFALAQFGHRLAMGLAHQKSEATELLNLPLLKSRSVDGLIMDLHTIHGDVGAVLARLDMPFIFINPLRMRSYNTVMPDDVAVASKAVEYLYQRGHRRIAYMPHIATTPHVSQFDRMKGYLETMSRHQLSALPLWDQALPVPGNNATEKHPDVAVVVASERSRRIELWVREHGCTGIVTYNALDAARVLAACHHLGLKVPDQISIISCDSDPVLELLPVQITCIALSRREMGQRAVEMLLERIENPQKDLPTWLTTGTLQEGASVKTLDS